MMKRNILAVVVPALLAAGAANAAEIYNKDGNKLDLYGRAQGLHYFSDNADNDGDQSYGRLGFKGQTQINDQLTGYGQFEYQFQFNNSESTGATGGDKTRLGFAGLKFGDAGSFDYGRNLGIAYDALAYTDMLPEFGGDFSKTDTMTGRTTGVATYRNKNFFGLVDGWDFGVQYQGKNDRTAQIQKSNGDGWGVSTSYTSPVGVGVVAAYASQDRTESQNASTVAYGRGDRAEFWAAGLKYDANNVYLAGTYGEGRNATPIANGTDSTVLGYANKSSTIEFTAQYQFDFGLRPEVSYVQGKAKDVEGIGDADLYKYVSVGGVYSFNKNMSTYVDYQINLLNDDNALGLANDDVVAVGLIYQF